MAEIRLKKRYKYVGDVFQELVEHAGFQPEVAVALLNDIPDADVAPRAEVAREIFEEMDKFFTADKLGLFTYRYYKYVIKELEKQYTEGKK